MRIFIGEGILPRMNTDLIRVHPRKSAAKTSVLTRLDHAGGCVPDFRRDKLVDFVFDQFAIDHPRLFSEDFAVRIHLGRLEKDVPRRAPVTFVAGKLAVFVMRSLLFVVFRFRLCDDWIRWSIRTEKATYFVASSVLADANHLESLILVLLIQLRRDGRF